MIFLISGYWGYKWEMQITKHSKNKYMFIFVSIFLFGINLFLAPKNSLVDLHYSKFNNFFLYYVCAYTGSISLILIMKYLVKTNRMLEFFGKNSLIVLVTHLPLFIVWGMKKLFKAVVTSTGIRYVDDIIVCLAVMLVEIIVITVVNKYGRFMIKCPIPSVKSSAKD